MSPGLRDSHPEFPWRAILAEEQARRTVHHSLPLLLAVVEGELAQLDGDG